LIKVGNTLDEKHEMERAQEFARFRDNNPDVDTNSVKMLQSKKERIISEIFDQLDGQKSGEIHLDNLNLDNFNIDLLRFFEPLFAQIQ
jgi:hypothetical protein